MLATVECMCARFFVDICVLFLILGGMAAAETSNGDISKPDDPQEEADALLERARQTSDIRKPGAPSFRLKATFTLVDAELRTLDGTYTEQWASEARWRREIVVGDHRQIEIASDGKLWVLDDPALPEKATNLPSILKVVPPKSAKFEFEEVHNSSVDSGVKCAATKPVGPHKAKSDFCFGSKTGVLLESATPEEVRDHLVYFVCDYGQFRKFGDMWFPYQMVCAPHGHRQLEVHIVELANESFNDLALFVAPAGALELGYCPAGATAPKVDFAFYPVRSEWQLYRVSYVTTKLVVDVKGKPQNIRVVQSAGKPLDDEAVGIVQRWRFKPATCNGEPVAAQVEVEVSIPTLR